jgi:hypothetical protein
MGFLRRWSDHIMVDAVRKDASLQVSAKGLVHKWLWWKAVGLTVDLSCANEHMQRLEVFDNP